MAGFLGVLINRSKDGKLEMLQLGLINRILSVLGLEGGNPKSTPAESTPLITDKEGEPCNEAFNYASVV